MIGDGVVQSGFAEGRFIDFGRVVDVSALIKVLLQIIFPKKVFFFFLELSLGAFDQVINAFPFLPLVLVQRHHVGPQGYILQFVLVRGCSHRVKEL